MSVNPPYLLIQKLWDLSPSCLKTMAPRKAATYYPSTVTSSPITFILPDLEAMCASLPAHDPAVSPHHASVCAESRAWYFGRSHRVLGPQTQAFFDSCKFELSASYFYPYMDKEGLRGTMDWHNILWFLDELTDTLTGGEALRAAEVVIRTAREPDFNDGSPLFLMVKDFYTLHLSRAGPHSAKRFVEHCALTFPAMAIEAELREKDNVLSIEGYLNLRRETSGIRTCFDMAEYLFGVDLPQDMYDDVVFQTGYNAAMDLVLLSNDLYSYNMEQSRGHRGANIVTAVMEESKVSLQAASDYVGTRCEKLIEILQHSRITLEGRFAKEADPTKAVALKDAIVLLVRYGYWVRGNIEWSFDTERYFGKDRKQIRESLMVTLTPQNSVHRSLKE